MTKILMKIIYCPFHGEPTPYCYEPHPPYISCISTYSKDGKTRKADIHSHLLNPPNAPIKKGDLIHFKNKFKNKPTWEVIEVYTFLRYAQYPGGTWVILSNFSKHPIGQVEKSSQLGLL